MNRINLHQDFIDELASDLRLKGYCFILNERFKEVDAESVRNKLIIDFKNLLYIEIDHLKKYFVNNNMGKKAVMKFIDSSIYGLKRIIISAEHPNGNSVAKLNDEMQRLTDLKYLLGNTKFE